MGQRLSGLLAWIEGLEEQGILPLKSGWEMSPVSGDASFRRYFRLHSGKQSWIAVDAPPDKEANDVFVDIARVWRAAGIAVPQVTTYDLQKGYMLLEDFGDQLLLPALNDDSADELYMHALDELIKIQTLNSDHNALPRYDGALLQHEMQLFSTWFVEQYLNIDLTHDDQDCIRQAFDILKASALEQPHVVVHRDYHSRNLMLRQEQSLGIIDFQDAVVGPVTYDAVSLLRDCYISWPDVRVYRWLEAYRVRAIAHGIIDDIASERFQQWFDLMGAQRHLKAIGIFARLSMRDDKHGYLHDIPRTLGYVYHIAKRYPALGFFAQWLDARILPALKATPLTLAPYL